IRGERILGLQAVDPTIVEMQSRAVITAIEQILVRVARGAGSRVLFLTGAAVYFWTDIAIGEPRFGAGTNDLKIPSRMCLAAVFGFVPRQDDLLARRRRTRYLMSHFRCGAGSGRSRRFAVEERVGGSSGNRSLHRAARAGGQHER